MNCKFLIAILLVSLLIPASYAATVTIYDGTLDPSDYDQVMQVEDSSKVTPGKNCASGFPCYGHCPLCYWTYRPSGSWISPTSSPQPGDTHIWLFDCACGNTWIKTVESSVDADEIVIQFKSCDSNDGIAKIFVDGVEVGQVNTYSNPSTDKYVVISGLTPGKHWVKVSTVRNLRWTGDLSIDWIGFKNNTPPVPEFPAAIVPLLLVVGGYLGLRRRSG